jgi:hypothetical protein
MRCQTLAVAATLPQQQQQQYNARLLLLLLLLLLLGTCCASVLSIRRACLFRIPRLFYLNPPTPTLAPLFLFFS